MLFGMEEVEWPVMEERKDGKGEEGKVREEKGGGASREMPVSRIS